jgi:hypothetical protein
MSRSNPVLTTDEWTPGLVKTFVPKVNDRGGKSIGLVSLETNRALQLSTPMMLTWGIADFVDKDTGESDGKYSASLVFPNGEYSTPATDKFLAKLKEFENKIIDEAVSKSEVWFGEAQSKEVIKYSFFPFLKYSKNKETNKIDHTKPPSLKVKVPYYDSKWGVEIYDTTQNRIFPCEDANLTPLDFVPKMSRIACVLHCGGIWIGGKGWGLTWKLVQCVVKPRENMSIVGKCYVMLSDDDRAALEAAPAVAPEDEQEDDETAYVAAPKEEAAAAPDTDDEAEAADQEEEAPAVAAAAAAAPAVKKVIKRAAPPVEADVAPATKKVVKKKVVV